MLFNSYIFVLVFLPITLLIFFALGKFGQVRAAIFALVIASLFFYGWWNPIYVPLILASMLVNYSLGVWLGRTKQSQRLPRAKLILTAGIAFNLGLLAYFKYANFFVDTLNIVGNANIQLAPIALPLAISFFTFQQIAYLADVYEGKAQEYDLLRYALFVTFFPQLIAGPIVHHKEMMPQFQDSKLARFCATNFSVGMAIFLIGLFKKVILADNVAPIASAVFNGADLGANVSFTEAWVGALAYSCQIYFDFSGYSDMAIGLGRIFGIKIPLNFNSPYQATGIIEFWRRWHMTLSRFLRDYLYIPLGGNRLGPNRRYVNMIIVMLLGGLWHGAGWNFVIWGGLHGVYLMVNHAWRRWRGPKQSAAFMARLASGFLTFIAVTFAWVFFRAETFSGALQIISAMLGAQGITIPLWSVKLPLVGEIVKALSLPLEATYWAQPTYFLWIAALLLIAWLMPNTQQCMRAYMDKNRYDVAPINKRWRWFIWQPNFVSAALVAGITVFAVLSLGRPSEFIYYQF